MTNDTPTRPSTFPADMLAGQAAIVTGGGSGIGFGIAQAMVQHGARVVIAARKMERLEAAAERLRADGGEALAVQCDIRDADQVEAMVQRTEEAFGPVRMLVNNAGATFWSKAEDLSPNGWRSVIDIDVNGTFFCSQAVARRMIPRGDGGAIVSITSTSPWTGNANRTNGGAGKAAVSSMMKSLAVEWGPHGIRLNEIAPGAIPTQGVTEQLGAHKAPDEDRNVPLGRVGTPADIANAVLFLMSDAASFMTGNTLVVDGGAWFASKRGGKGAAS
ncbi:MAG: glucose 1-dehydrogenase [Dehalococcoidia bacterium]|nr:glucose 1-dehydrogenase [Dehalococcoidia bacterium]